jgi:RNA polymerase sigma factor for flagellar operon FliA
MSTEPHVRVQQEDGARRLQQMLGLLPKNQQLMLQLYYKHDLNLKEIGDILGVTESRVSQLHSQATHRLKMQFQSSRDNL